MTLNFSQINPNQSGYRWKVFKILLGKARKLAIKFSLFLVAITGFTLAFIIRFGVALSLDILTITDALFTGLMNAYQKMIAVILSIVT